MTDLNDKVRKFFENAAQTNSTLTPAQEPLRFHLTSNPEDVLSNPLPAEFAGSWASSFSYGYRASIGGIQDTGVAPPVSNVESQLGMPGLPDLEFNPYNYGTNIFGTKGQSLIGHPISFDVIGGTLKSTYSTHIWNVNFAANTLTLGTFADIAEGYGINAIPDGGLYVVIRNTGVDSPECVPGANALIPTTPGSYFEIFRVTDLTGSVLTLDSAKRISTYFNSSGAINVTRSVLLLVPKVARVIAIQGSGQVGKELVYAVLPPEKSASGEFFPPFGSNILAGTWLGGGIEPLEPLRTGEPTLYNSGVDLPVPTPRGPALVSSSPLDATRSLWGYVTSTTTASPGMDAIPLGTVDIWVDHTDITNIGDLVDDKTILHIHGIENVDTTGSHIIEGGNQTLMGWFRVQTITPGATYNQITLRRLPEVNPVTGVVTYGGGYEVDGAGPVYGPSSNIRVRFTTHDTVTSLFYSPRYSDAYRADAVEATRLTNIIPPRTSGRALDKATYAVQAGSTPARADRAIFNTLGRGTDGHNEDPGSLLDLGFRMVLYPAKLVGTDFVPNYNRPIYDLDNAILDSSVTAAQSISVDYANGLVTLSHPPIYNDKDSVLWISGATTLTVKNNPRGEMVFFVACVPSSMEEGQQKNGIRVTGGSAKSNAIGLGYEQSDALGGRVIFPSIVSWTPGGAGLPGTLIVSDPDGFPYGSAPYTGYLYVWDTSLTSWLGPYLYNGTSYNIGAGRLTFNGVCSGGPRGGLPFPVPSATTHVVLCKNPAVNPIYDTTRGASKKFSDLKFSGIDFSMAPDGSISLTPTRIVNYSLNDAYNNGVTPPVGVGRTINLTGEAVEASRSFSTPTIDPTATHFRATSDNSLAIGFDFVESTTAIAKSVAGFLDRSPIQGDGVSSTFTYVETGVTAVSDSIKLAAHLFWSAGPFTNLSLGVDMVYLGSPTLKAMNFEGYYVIQVLDGADTSTVHLVDFMGVAATFGGAPITDVTASFYRPNFASRYGAPLVTLPRMKGTSVFGFDYAFAPNASYSAFNIYSNRSAAKTDENQWAFAQSISYRSVDGSNSSVWSVDAIGRVYHSPINQGYFQGTDGTFWGGSFASLTLRGDDVITSHQKIGLGHIVAEAQSPNVNRYDFLSMNPMWENIAPTLPVSYDFIVISPTKLQITTVLTNGIWLLHIVPQATLATVLSLTPSAPSSVHNLLMVRNAEENTAGAHQKYLTVLCLDGSSPGFNPGDTGSIILHTAQRLGSRFRGDQAIPEYGMFIKDSLFSSVITPSFTPYNVFMTGGEANSTALALFSGVDTRTDMGGKIHGQFPLRVFAPESLLITDTPLLREIAAIGNDGSFWSRKTYNYEQGGRAVILSLPLMSARKGFTTDTWNYGFASADVWTNNTNPGGEFLLFDIPLPTGCELLSVTIGITPTGGLGATKRIGLLVDAIMANETPGLPTVTPLIAMVYDDGTNNPQNLVADVSLSVDRWTSPSRIPSVGGSLVRHRISVKSSSDGVAALNDSLFNVIVTYKDPGPRNW